MFGSENIRSMTVVIADPGADAKSIALWRAPVAAEILRAYIVCQNAQAEGSAGNFALHNFGTSGTAVEGTVAAGKGGTASANRLAAATPVAYTLTEGTMAAGEWLYCQYEETGDFIEGLVSITFDYVTGIGA
jgi:hypothetical protein